MIGTGWDLFLEISGGGQAAPQAAGDNAGVMSGSPRLLGGKISQNTQGFIGLVIGHKQVIVIES